MEHHVAQDTEWNDSKYIVLLMKYMFYYDFHWTCGPPRERNSFKIVLHPLLAVDVGFVLVAGAAYLEA